MADPEAQLLAAAQAGNAAAVAAVLAAGADPNEITDRLGRGPLHLACEHGHLACVEALLAGGASPNADAFVGRKPLHEAAFCGFTSCASALLAGGADPFASNVLGFTALYFAAFTNHPSVAQLLLEAAPQAALAKVEGLGTPLAAALRYRHIGAACCLLELAPLVPAGVLLALMEAHRTPEPLYAPLVACQPLSPTEWERVPAPCPGLGAALPAVLERSAEEAAQLVRLLPSADRNRRQTAALCMARVQRRRGVALPPEIVGSLLASTLAE